MAANYDEEQMKEHYIRYKDMVFRIAMIYMGNIEEAKDVTQEVFIKLMKRGLEFAEESHEKRWLIQVTKNLCCDICRSIWSKRISLMEIEEQYYENDHQGFEVMESVIKLKEKYKFIVILYYYEGYKISEIAEILKQKESTIKMRLKKAREILKIELEELKWKKKIWEEHWIKS